MLKEAPFLVKQLLTEYFFHRYITSSTILYGDLLVLTTYFNFFIKISLNDRFKTKRIQNIHTGTYINNRL